jgi:hypothetical protein
MPCKGICIRHKASGRYATGNKRCQQCDLFIKWDGLWCPCCGYKLRTGPRHCKLKAKLRKEHDDKNYGDLSYNTQNNQQILMINWWLNELDSLGVKPKKINILNDIQELGSLTDNIKQTFYQDYKTSYGEDTSIQKLV